MALTSLETAELNALRERVAFANKLQEIDNALDALDNRDNRPNLRLRILAGIPDDGTYRSTSVELSNSAMVINLFFGELQRERDTLRKQLGLPVDQSEIFYKRAILSAVAPQQTACR